jgi:hypothetical protein
VSTGRHWSGPRDDEPACTIERSLQILGERWSFLELREIFAGCQGRALGGAVPCDGWLVLKPRRPASLALRSSGVL